MVAADERGWGWDILQIAQIAQIGKGVVTAETPRTRRRKMGGKTLVQLRLSAYTAGSVLSTWQADLMAESGSLLARARSGDQSALAEPRDDLSFRRG
jgi:hypothetical protein